MKKVAIALGMLAVVLLGIMAYNVWRGETQPVAKTPDIVEQGRMDLHAKLMDAERHEAEIEKTYWSSPEQLRILIHSHEQRIDQLKDNRAGADIVAHDKDAIARLEKRISDIETEREAQAKAQAEQAKQAAAEARQARQNQ